MPPPGYEPFLRAICANPEDDTARLVYADWLQENGDEARAEFIRVQIEMERHRVTRSVDNTLLARHTAAAQKIAVWQSELPSLPGINWPGFFTRGFPYQVDASDGRWLVRHHDTIFSAAPIEHLSVNNAGEGTLVRVMRLTELSRVSTLWLTNCRLIPGQWSVLAECPHLTKLTTLASFRSFVIGNPAAPAFTVNDAKALVRSPFLSNELKLTLHGWISDEAREILQARFAQVSAGRAPPTPPPGS